MQRAIPGAIVALCLLAPFAVRAQAPIEPDRPASRERMALSSPADTEYQVGPEDVLFVRVWERPELSGLVTVDLSGQIHAPLVGAVQAVERTPAQLSEGLTERYQLLDRSITEVLVSVAQYNSRSVTVLGQVRNPGMYGFREMPGIWEAILTAGGSMTDAELGAVQVVREVAPGLPPQTFAVDLSRGIDGTPPDRLPELQPKDKIVVPSTAVVPTGGDKFHVIGAVNNPGVYRLSAARTVLEAIAASGGPGEAADMSKVYLTRPTDSGAVAYELNLAGYLERADPLVNLELQPGDTITVPRERSLLRAMGEGLARVAPFIWLITSVLRAAD